MNLSLNAEQSMLKQSAERFAAERYDDAARRAHAGEPEGFDRAMWRDMAELGWIGAALPEEVGGFGGGPVETMVLMEQAGASLMQEPFLPAMVMAGRALIEAGVGADALEAYIAGREIVVTAFGGPEDGEKPVLVSDGTDGRLSGTVAFALNADGADRLLIAARGAEGSAALVVVPGVAEGMELTPFRTLDGRHAAHIALDDMRVSADQVIARGATAESAIRTAGEHGIAALCAEAVGIGQSLFDRTLAYVKEREQFGQPIARFQALQHRLADMYVALEEARSLAVMATVKLRGPEGPDRARGLAGALAGTLRRTLDVARESIQLHGGIGMTEDLPVGAGFRRLKTMELMVGGIDRHLDGVVADWPAADGN